MILMIFSSQFIFIHLANTKLAIELIITNDNNNNNFYDLIIFRSGKQNYYSMFLITHQWGCKSL